MSDLSGSDTDTDIETNTLHRSVRRHKKYDDKIFLKLTLFMMVVFIIGAVFGGIIGATIANKFATDNTGYDYYGYDNIDVSRHNDVYGAQRYTGEHKKRTVY